jgi:hypothetical protein
MEQSLNCQGEHMSELKIKCPKCSNEIELTEQLAGPMLADLRASFNDELAKRDTQATEAFSTGASKVGFASRRNAQTLKSQQSTRSENWLIYLGCPFGPE